MLTICLWFYLNFAFKSLSVSLKKTEYDTADAKDDYGRENKNCAVHKEVLRKNQYNIVVYGVEDPVLFAGEEYHMENFKSAVKIKGAKSAYNRKSAERVCACGEDNVFLKGSPKLEHAHLI